MLQHPSLTRPEYQTPAMVARLDAALATGDPDMEDFATDTLGAWLMAHDHTDAHYFTVREDYDRSVEAYAASCV